MATPLEIEAAWVEEYLAASGSCFRPAAGGEPGVLGRLLVASGRLAWDVEQADLAVAVEVLAREGAAPTLIDAGVRAFTGFHRFLASAKSAAIEARFGLGLTDPFLEQSAMDGADRWPTNAPPPRAERLESFFAFLRARLASARQFGPAGRDYAALRTLYHAGLRPEEVCALRVDDVHLRRGPSGALVVRPLPVSGLRQSRTVPMLDGLDVILRWYLEDARPASVDSPWLICDELGGPLRRGRLRTRLAFLLELEGLHRQESFSPHGLRHACAVRNYERGLDLASLATMLGHPDAATTLRYVRPAATFGQAQAEITDAADPAATGERRAT